MNGSTAFSRLKKLRHYMLLDNIELQHVILFENCIAFSFLCHIVQYAFNIAFSLQFRVSLQKLVMCVVTSDIIIIIYVLQCVVIKHSDDTLDFTLSIRRQLEFTFTASITPSRTCRITTACSEVLVIIITSIIIMCQC